MVRIERGNVVLDVKEDAVEHYMALGYNVIDEQGRIVKTAVPTHLGTLQAAFVRSEAKIADLEARIKELEAENASLKSKKASKSKAKED